MTELGFRLEQRFPDKPVCKIVALLNMQHKGNFTREDARDAFYDYVHKHSMRELSNHVNKLWITYHYRLDRPSDCARYWLNNVSTGAVKIACWGLE
ncbi:MAG: hypothetical protein Q7K45_01670, partial [Nanoarchaeota archaeon]|nr:hypothetical protein [Nanoarchaeota archaeon]